MTEGMVEKALAETGLTYRRLDHWTRKGYLRVEERGTGNPRTWAALELEIAATMERLTAAGFRTEAAADVARDAVEQMRASRVGGVVDGAAIVILGPSLRLVVLGEAP